MTMLVSVVLASTTGIIGGEIVLLGLIALPQMLRLGYNRRLAIGTICAGGSLGTMIPPSIILIFYGLTANVSISHLFLASVAPGLLLAAVYAGYIVIRCWLDPSMAPPAPLEERDMSVAQKLSQLKSIALPVGVAFAVLGSIYLGVASITESAGLGVVGVLIAIAVRGELTRELIVKSLKQTMLTCGVVVWLVFGTNGLVGVYNAMGGIQFLQSGFVSLDLGVAGTLAVMVVVFIVLGAFIDWIGIMFLTIPIFLPIIKNMGLDAIWFGIVFNVSMQIAYLSPPFAPAAFYLKGVAPADMSIEEIFSALWPFIGLQILVLIAILAFPQISLWLPRLAYQ
jgi:tripartite ATP-independent transporter DctM subunit